MRMHYASIALALAFGLLTAATAMAQTRMEKAVVATGGGRTGSSTTMMDYTVSQTAVGYASSSSTVGQFGFWNVLLAPSSVDVTTGAGGVTALSVQPNPVIDRGMVEVTLARSGQVDVILYDMNGQQVATLLSGSRTAGTFEVPLEGAGLPSGTYFVAVSVPGALLQRPVTIVR